MRTIKIFIDAGHGGRDSGAVGNGLQEKDIALSVAKKVGVLLGRSGVMINYSRATDIYLNLTARAQMANAWGADLFLSVHVNSAENKSARGIETFHFPNSANGKELARNIQNELIALGLYTDPKHNRGVKSANFAVLRETKMPAALVELAFISNSEDAKLLRANEDNYANAVFKAVIKYVNRNKKIEESIDLSIDQFIEKIAGMVEETPKRILPSITIAQAILESNWGKSDLAVKANNLFGIKASTDWAGRYFTKITTEEKDGKKYQTEANFRAYANWSESIKDHDDFFVTPAWRQKHYANVLSAENYVEQANALTGTYATDSKYGEKLIKLIERYNLDSFDEFSDVSEVHKEDWKWGIDLELVDGTNPKDPATREQVITILKRYTDLQVEE